MKKDNILLIDPCQHKVCFDCLSVWFATHGETCPICRSKVEYAYGRERKGGIKRKIVIKSPPQINFGNFQKPNPKEGWQKRLAKLWEYIPHRVWGLLYSYGIENQVIYSLIMKTLSTMTKEEAKVEIDKYIGSIIPNFIDELLDFDVKVPEKVEYDEELERLIDE